MKELFTRLREFAAGLSPRERTLVGLGGGLLLVGLLYTLIWEPLESGRIALAKRIQTRQRDVVEMQHMRDDYLALLNQYELRQKIIEKADPKFSLFPHIETTVGQVVGREKIASMNPQNKEVGAGAYRHHVPATVDHLIQRSEWLTAYTPYQPEISQGTLQMLFEFQTQVAKITGMDVANASLYDGSTGTAEAVLMARRLTRRNKIVLSGGLHPHYRDVVKAYLKDDPNLECLSPSPEGQGDILDHIDGDTAAIVIQTPDFYGHLRNVKAAAEAAHAQGALLIVVVTEVVSLGLLEAPGALGADIVVAEGQSIGNALNFGGPYLGLMATKKEFIRQMPGRLFGVPDIVAVAETDQRRPGVSDARVPRPRETAIGLRDAGETSVVDAQELREGVVGGPVVDGNDLQMRHRLPENRTYRLDGQDADAKTRHDYR